MPLYDFKCRECRTVTDRFASIDTREVRCECGGTAERIISTSYRVHGDIEPYVDENITDKPVLVKSKKHRARLLEKYGLIERIGKGWT